MPNRAQRRAAARFAAKQSAQTASVETAKVMTATPGSTFAFEPTAAAEPRQVSDAQLAANRANAQLSTGPRTETGKAAIRHNALKSGLTGQTVLLPTDDVEAYQKLSRHFINQYRPVGCEEEGLVQSLIDSNWRLRRIPSLEAGIYVIGRNEFAKDESIPANLIDSHVYLKYERQLRNLCVQESRLSRKIEKDLSRLRSVQSERLLAEQRAAKAAAEEQDYETDDDFNPSFPDPADPKIGFEFSTPPLKTEKVA